MIIMIAFASALNLILFFAQMVEGEELGAPKGYLAKKHH